jgi:hypothetical protein
MLSRMRFSWARRAKSVGLVARGAVAPVAMNLRRGAASGWRSPAAWCLAGFLSGIVFWHLVGFWGFVAHIVLKGEDRAPAAAAIAPRAAGRHALPLSDPAARCVALRLSRSGGAVEAGPCASHSPLVRAGPLARRGDRALPHVPAVAGWSTQVRPPTDAGAEPP